MFNEKQLGKIQKVHLGLRDGRLGIQFTLGDGSWGVCTQWRGSWHKRPETAKWTVEEQTTALGLAMLSIGDLLADAKKTDVYDLVNVPVEATFKGGVLTSWRILKEVL